MKWFIKVLKHYADFSGRARRKEYWMFVLFNLIFSSAWSFLLLLLFLFTNSNNIVYVDEAIIVASIIVGLSYLFVVLLPTMAVTVRRLHDIGESGWMMLVALIPIVGGIWLFVQMLKDGDMYNNKYGANPKMSPKTFDEPMRLKSAGIILIVASVAAILTNITSAIILNKISQAPSAYHMINITTFVLLLLSGILILNEKTIYAIRGKVKNAMILLLTASSVKILQFVLDFFSNKNAEVFFMWQIKIDNFCFLASNLLIAFFVASVLFSKQNKNLIRNAATAVIVFMGLYLLWRVYYVMSFVVYDNSLSSMTVWGDLLNLLGIFFILMHIAYIVLAGTFYPESRFKNK